MVSVIVQQRAFKREYSSRSANFCPIKENNIYTWNFSGIAFTFQSFRSIFILFSLYIPLLVCCPRKSWTKLIYVFTQVGTKCFFTPCELVTTFHMHISITMKNKFRCSFCETSAKSILKSVRFPWGSLRVKIRLFHTAYFLPIIKAQQETPLHHSRQPLLSNSNILEV